MSKPTGSHWTNTSRYHEDRADRLIGVIFGLIIVVFVAGIVYFFNNRLALERECHERGGTFMSREETCYANLQEIKL